MTVDDSIDYPSDIESEDIVIKFNHPEHDISLVFYQDYRVGYAYLILDEEVISDAWLYNIDYAPPNPEWHIAGCEMPFRNAIEYVVTPILDPVKAKNEVNVQWIDIDENIIRVHLFIKNELMGILQNGYKPGWSKMALMDNPIAKSLNTHLSKYEKDSTSIE